MACPSASASSDQTIKLWNLKTGQVIQTLRLQPADGIVHTLQISPDGKRLISATTQNKLQLWDDSTGRLIWTFVDESVNLNYRLPIQFSSNGQQLATADIDHSVKLWNATNGARIVTLKGHSQGIQSVAFSPDGQSLASSSADNTVKLWNLRIYKMRRTLQVADSAGHPTRPTNHGYLAFSPDGQVLATSALLLPLVQTEPIPGLGISLWNVANGQRFKELRGVSRFSFSPNNQFLVTTPGSTLQVWRGL